MAAAATDWRLLNRAASAEVVRRALEMMGTSADELVVLLECLLAPPTAEAGWTGPAIVTQSLLLSAMGDVRGEQIGELMVLRSVLERFSGATSRATAQVRQGRGFRYNPVFFSLVAGCLSSSQMEDSKAFKAVACVVYMAALGNEPEESRWRGMWARWKRAR